MPTITKPTYALLKAKKHRTVEHPVVLDEEPIAEYAQLRRELNAAKARADQPEIDRLTAAVAAAEPAAEAAVLTVKVRAIPRPVYAAMKAAHPPTDEDHKRAQEVTDNPKAKAQWHPDGFRPELVAACLAEPEVTVEQAQELADTWNEAEWNALVAACISVNEYAADTTSLVFSSGRTRS